MRTAADLPAVPCGHAGLPELQAAAPLPVTGVAGDYPAGMEVQEHSHECCQLLYAVQGVLEVRARSGRWVVPPTRGVWLCSGVPHSLRMRGAVQVRSLFVDAQAAQGLPVADCVIEVSPLLRELISEVARWPAAPQRGQDETRDRLVVELLLQELRQPPVVPFHLPWPQDARMAAVCRALAEGGQAVGQGGERAENLAATAADWAARLAMGEKTFHRHFLQATGLSFGRWRQRARLLSSMQALLAGRPIVQVALEAGYESHSAYSLAFRRQFGMPPSAFGAGGGQP
ncbi:MULTISPECIES: AraC family transcriptional regulator [Delftia]|jgi:AraC-like DNA-binding protein|uniref:AraC family transcriptional regulator n=1 Tax=Delftia TaxID=80865 RepID=UPI000646477C|nr:MULTISPECIES: helix-turn-helix transcriptional regulator [Delftia]MDC2859948.1 helix-turn-helix transcriptional regulator [Delftia sp. DT-2]MDH0776699.1 helix-turn-helix transcriptional regulator [Delftia tsuruhatensis]MDH0846793.1 helix-turn-helix transcriptional regulator [Delftia tsuruhatensis]MDH1460422.1 helix-turn-helix transcriptional regulator [Delftia tsuruhatensis]MDH1826793.1 helix-turn-helix transcriptional regulator [Delftia tsuruhatensis]